MLLRSLYFDGPASRLELARRSGLSPATAGTVVGELLDDGVVRETGQVESDGGRPATLVAVRPEAALTIGVDVGETGIRAELFDLCLGRLADAHLPLDPHAVTVTRAAEAVTEVVRSLLDAAHEQQIPMLGIGIGMPGVVDARDQVVHVPSLGWQAVPFGALVGWATDVPVLVDNGAKTMGRAEAWFGAGRGSDDLVSVLIGTGVGAAIITGGRVYRGISSSAGEWGHTTVQTTGGAACRCGNRGCLEAYVGAAAIARRWVRAAGQASSDDVAVVTDLAAAAQAGSAAARQVCEDVAEYLAAGVGSLANLLNPQRVVVGGWVGLLLGPHLLPLVEERLKQRALAPARANLDLQLSHFGPDAVALGAATLPVEQFLAGGGRQPSRSLSPDATAVQRAVGRGVASLEPLGARAPG